MPGHDIVVIGARGGGVEPLAELFSRLPAHIPASFFVVLHVPDRGISVLPDILGRRGPLPAMHPADGARIEPGRVYVAPPGYHLLVKRGCVRLVRGPRENGARPAVDPLFRTAVAAYGRRVVAVVLTGTLDDGTAGLQAVKTRGGTAVVQDPDEAMYGGMPRSAVERRESRISACRSHPSFICSVAFRVASEDSPIWRVHSSSSSTFPLRETRSASASSDPKRRARTSA